MPGRARHAARALALALAVAVAASCGGGDSDAESTTPTVAVPAAMPAARSMAELTRLLAARGVKVGSGAGDDRGTVADAWGAFRRFASIDVDDPFLAEPVEEEGDALLFRAVPSARAEGPTFAVNLVRRYRFNDFSGRYNRQEQIRLTVHLPLTEELAEVSNGGLWSTDQPGADRAAQRAAWERAVESTPTLERLLSADVTPVAIEVVEEEGDVH